MNTPTERYLVPPAGEEDPLIFISPHLLFTQTNCFIDILEQPDNAEVLMIMKKWRKNGKFSVSKLRQRLSEEAVQRWNQTLTKFCQDHSMSGFMLNNIIVMAFFRIRGRSDLKGHVLS